eukprot:13128091-Ditylum_brightwellii.AAC.1
MNTVNITTAAATAVRIITDDLRINEKATIVKEAHIENDAAANVTIDDSDLTSKTMATSESSVLNTPEVTKIKNI